MTTAAYITAWSAIVMNRDHEAVAAWSSSWRERDWAAAESSRLEASPVDAPVDLGKLAPLSIPKVVVRGGWPEDLAGGSAAGAGFRAVAETIATRIGADVSIFERSTHNPQLQEPDAFNELLRRVWG